MWQGPDSPPLMPDISTAPVMPKSPKPKTTPLRLTPPTPRFGSSLSQVSRPAFDHSGGTTPPECRVPSDDVFSINDEDGTDGLNNEQREQLLQWDLHKDAKHGGVSEDCIEMLGELGCGSFGTVVKAVHKKSGIIMARKFIKNFATDSRTFKNVRMELDAMLRSSSKYIVQYYGAFLAQSNGQLSLFMEYMNCGSLDACVDKKLCVPEPVLRVVTRSVLLAMWYLLDELKMMHRDIKPSNMLVNTRGEVKLADFGISGYLDENMAAKTNFGCGRYMAPERLDKNYTIASESWIWFFLNFELTSCYEFRSFRRFLFGFKLVPDDDYFSKIFHFNFCGCRSPFHLAVGLGDVPKFPEDKGYSPELISFVDSCLKVDPNQRESIPKLLQSRFLCGTEDSADIVKAFLREKLVKPGKFVTVHLLYGETIKVEAVPEKTVAYVLEKKVKERHNQNIFTCNVFVIGDFGEGYRDGLPRSQINLNFKIEKYAGRHLVLEPMDHCLGQTPTCSNYSHTFEAKSFIFAICEGCNKRFRNGYHCVRCGFRFHEQCSARVPQLYSETARRMLTATASSGTNVSDFLRKLRRTKSMTRN